LYSQRTIFGIWKRLCFCSWTLNVTLWVRGKSTSPWKYFPVLFYTFLFIPILFHSFLFFSNLFCTWPATNLDPKLKKQPKTQRKKLRKKSVNNSFTRKRRIVWNMRKRFSRFTWFF
jgi:hypothetical protein